MSGCIDTNKKCDCWCHAEGMTTYNCCKCHGDRFFIEPFNIDKRDSRITNCELQFAKLERHIKHLEEQIKLLEKYIPNHSMQIDENRKISKRVDELEKKLNELVSKQDFYQHLTNAAICASKKPYKCPVCEGKASIKKYVEPMVLSFEECVACQCKGIVWG